MSVGKKDVQWQHSHVSNERREFKWTVKKMQLDCCLHNKWSVVGRTLILSVNEASLISGLPPAHERVSLFPFFFLLSLGTLPAVLPQLIAAALWRGCFLSSCSCFHIWALRPASQEGLMGNQSSWFGAALLENVWPKFPKGQRGSSTLSLPRPINSLRARSSWHVTPGRAFVKSFIPNNIPAVEVLMKIPSTCWCISPLLAPSEHIVWGVWSVVMDLRGGKTKAMKTGRVGGASASLTLTCPIEAFPASYFDQAVNCLLRCVVYFKGWFCALTPAHSLKVFLISQWSTWSKTLHSHFCFPPRPPPLWDNLFGLCCDNCLP